MNAVSALLSAGYFLIFNLTYSVIWFVSVLLLRPMLRMVGHELPRGYTDVWATGWGVALLRGGLFLSRARVRLNMDDRIADHDGPFVVVMNHQATFDIAVAFYVLWRAGGRRMRWVLKKELLRAPVVRQACLETRSAFVDRRNRRQAAAELRRFAADLKQDRVSGVIFVEGTRATPDKIRRSRWQNLLEPRPAGFAVLREELPDWPVLSVTLHWHGKDGVAVFNTGIWKSLLQVECTMYEPDALPSDGGAWLEATEWPRCDALITRWKTDRTLIGQAPPWAWSLPAVCRESAAEQNCDSTPL